MRNCIFCRYSQQLKVLKKGSIINWIPNISICSDIIVFRDEELELEAKEFLKMRNILSQVKDYAIMPRGTNRQNGGENLILGFIFFHNLSYQNFNFISS